MTPQSTIFPQARFASRMKETPFVSLLVPMLLVACGQTDDSMTHSEGGSGGSSSTATGGESATTTNGGNAPDLTDDSDGGVPPSNDPDDETDAGPGSSGGVDGSGPAVSCAPLSCPELGTCTLEQEGDTCLRICQFDETYPLRDTETVERLAALECEIIEGTLSFSLQEPVEQDTLNGLNTIRQVTSLGVDLFQGQVFQGLERIDCSLLVNSIFSSDGDAEEFELSALRTIGYGLQINETSNLPSIRFPALTELGDSDPSLCSDDGLSTFDGLLIYITRELTRVDLPVLRQMTGQFYFGDVPDLEAICLPALEDVTARRTNGDEENRAMLSAEIICLSDAFSADFDRVDACPVADQCL